MNKAIKGIALAGLSAMMSVSFFACDKEEGKQIEPSEVRCVIEKMYSLGYTDMEFWHVTVDEGDVGETDGIDMQNENGENVYAYLFANETDAKAYYDTVAADGAKQHGKWVVSSDIEKGITDFCSTTKGESLELLELYDRASQLSFAEYLEGDIMGDDEDAFGWITVAGADDDVEIGLFKSEDAAKYYYNNDGPIAEPLVANVNFSLIASGKNAKKRVGKWVIEGNSGYVNEIIDILP